MLIVMRLLITAWLVIGSAFAFSPPEPNLKGIALSELPREARQTLQLIEHGGPFPHARDGTIFGNFEKRLPVRPRGYYREYTVPSPWRRDRGPRRIVSGSSGEYFYTADHYRTFRRIHEDNDSR